MRPLDRVGARPKIEVRAGGQQGSILDLMDRHAAETDALGESDWLKKHGIPTSFWGRSD